MDHEKNGQAEARQGLFLNIPLGVSRRDDLTLCAKVAYGMINTLCRINGGSCTASNEHLADSIGVCTKSLKSALTLLVKRKLVRRVMHGQYRESLSILGGGGSDGGHEPSSGPPGIGEQKSPQGREECSPSHGEETSLQVVNEVPHSGERTSPQVVKDLPQGWWKKFPTGGETLGGQKLHTQFRGEKPTAFPPLDTHADAREASAGPSARGAPGPASGKRVKPEKTGAEIEAERRALDAILRETRRVEQHIADLSEAPMDDPIIRREMEAREAGEAAVLLPDPPDTPPEKILKPHAAAMKAALEARKAAGQ